MVTPLIFLLATPDFIGWNMKISRENFGIKAIDEAKNSDRLGGNPVNDNLINAIPLAINATCSGDAYTNMGATIQSGEPSGSCHYNGDSAQTTVWFSFVAPNNGEVVITTDIPPADLYDAQIAVFDAPSDLNDLSTLTNEVGCDEDSGVVMGLMSIVELTGLTAGSTYYIQIDGYNGSEGGFCIELINDACPQPSNFIMTNLGDDSASFTWLPGADETTWEVEYGSVGFPLGTGTVVSAGPNPEVDLTDLSPSTSYEVYLTAICGPDVSGALGPIAFSTYGQDQCGQSQTSNGFENAFFMEEGGQLIANDFSVAAGTVNFSLENITANLWTTGGVVSMDLLFFQDNEGIPGEQIGNTIENLVPTSQTVIGTAAGFDVEKMVLDLPNPINFPGNSTENTIYWIQMIATPVVPGTQVAWEVTRAGTIGYETAYNDNSGTWSSSAGNDGVFTILGTCNLMAVENQELEDFTFYPNPVKDKIFLKAIRKIEEVAIYDISGREMEKIRPNSFEQTFMMDELPSGIFIMKIKIDGSVGIYRIIKE